MDRPVPAALYNMCMVVDPKKNLVLVQDKIEKDGWGGITFPGGHLEPGESVLHSAIREVREETGLIVDHLAFAGMIDYWNRQTGLRWLCFLYKTSSFQGELLERTQEGPVFWTDASTLSELPLAPHMEQYLTLFTDDKALEAYAAFDAGQTDELEVLY